MKLIGRVMWMGEWFAKVLLPNTVENCSCWFGQRCKHCLPPTTQIITTAEYERIKND